MDKLMQFMHAHASGLQRMTAQLSNVEARLQQIENDGKKPIIIAPSVKAEIEQPDSVARVSELEDHRTAPQKLLRVWPCFQPILKSAGVEFKDSYVRDAEDRGVLPLYDRGEGVLGRCWSNDSLSRAFYAPVENDSISTRSSDSSRGSDSPLSVISLDSTATSWGGLLTDGTLDLTPDTVNLLFDSYVRHMHVMHPFIDKGDLRRALDTFLAALEQKLSRKRCYAEHEAQYSIEEMARAAKRKRGGHASDGSFVARPDTVSQKGLQRLPEQAVIYLVLALGKICLHKDALPSTAPLQTPHMFQECGPASQDLIQSLTVCSIEQSRSNTPRQGPRTPTSQVSNADAEHLRQSRRPSTDTVNSRSSLGLSNLQVIPGLAYYAKAAEILGEHGDGNDLVHAQMYLLAGLYKGQLARIGEAMSWITRASRVAMTLLDRYKLYNNNYWTGHGDIRAKLASGQARNSDKVGCCPTRAGHKLMG
jgi:hypothetical protein